MISEELSAWMVARREVLSWADQVALIGLAAQSSGDDAFLSVVKSAGPSLSKAVAGYDEALFKVGPAANQALFAKIRADVAAMPDDVMPDVPYDYNMDTAKVRS